LLRNIPYVGGINLCKRIAQNLILIVDFVNMAVWLMEFTTQENIISLPDVDLHNDQIKLLLIFI
jgi:hypothetical protein